MMPLLLSAPFLLPVLLAGANVPTVAANPTRGTKLEMPRFRYETDWIKLPAGMVTGEIVSVAIDRHDHLWLLHRFRTAKGTPNERAAPPILEFDPQGRFLRGFGGPAAGYEWPSTEHSIALATNGEIWIGGNNREKQHGDDMLLVFDRDGRFLRQIGQRGAGKGNFDRNNVRAPGDIFVDSPRREVYVADGYVNQRLLVLDQRTGAWRRMWGAFGAPPPKDAIPTPENSAVFNGVHGVERSRDGLFYVSDRGNQRIQVFTRMGQYKGQVVVNRGLTSPLTVSGITFSRDRQQRYLYAADWGNGMIVIIDRKTLAVLGTIGRSGTAPGEFMGPHLIDTDSKGIIYVAEVQGRRMQRLIPLTD